MKLEKKKNLIARTLNVGKSRVIINIKRMQEIKEAITKQDIRDLLNDKAISIREVKGRRTIRKRKTRRRAGSIKQRPSRGKQKYVKLTRKLRGHLFQLKKNKKISQESFLKLRKQIRTKEFRSLSHMKERIKEAGVI